MEFKLETENCINKLDAENSVNKLSYVKDALLLLRKQIGDSKAMRWVFVVLHMDPCLLYD